MTTKPKTRKAPAAKAAPKAAPEKAVSETKHEVSEIARLVSRWKWLQADQEYQAEIATTEEENERLIVVHDEEQVEIEDKLASLVPEKVYEACTLLKFVAGMIEHDLDPIDLGDGAIVSMLRNIDVGLRAALRDEDTATRENLKAERAKGHAEGRAYVREIFEISEQMDKSRREREAASP